MKRIVLFLVLIAISNQSIGQDFPSPENLEIEVCYNNYPVGGEYCGPEYPIYATVHHYIFDAPNLTGVESELIGYNLYYNDEFMAFFNYNEYEAECYGAGDYYVTAVYINPSGESSPSNTVYTAGFLISVDDPTLTNTIKVFPNPISNNRKLTITSENQINSILVYNLLGKELLRTNNNIIDLSNKKTGIYFLTIKTSNGILTKKIILK